MTLLDRCRVSSISDDRFVGIRSTTTGPEIVFPRGYRLSKDPKGVRRDAVQLISLIKRMSEKREGEGYILSKEGFELEDPFFAYQYIIHYYFENGPYIERDVRYIRSNDGKINWKRTIQQTQPIISDGSIVYLDTVVRKKEANENNLITIVYNYCVEKSFEKIGWLYTSKDFVNPTGSVPFNKKLFTSVVVDKMNATFDDNKRRLFHSMLQILQQEKATATDKKDFSYGVNRFEYVWESLIDYVFGEDNRDIYFPHAEWDILENGKFGIKSSALRPDTIIRYRGNTYVVDAKYYRYGLENNVDYLPATDSIQKQITYGEYIEKEKLAGDGKIYNAFVIPYASTTNNQYEFVGVGRGKWIQYGPNTPEHKYVLAILLDTRYIIDSYAKHDLREIDMLSNLIESSLAKYRKKT